jgi:Cu(I)/Ag(I) efflux system membrane fusion protein
MATHPPDPERSVEPRGKTQEKPMKNRLSFVPKPVWWIGLVVVVVLLLAIPLGIHPLDTWIHRLLGHPEGQPPHQMVAEKGQRKILFYRNPMDPTITSPVPRKDEMGMDYVPVYADEATPPAHRAKRKILFYRNPMDPTITSPVPRKDEMGMDYVPVYADEAEAGAGQGATVTIDPVVVQDMNVVTAKVTRRDVHRQIRTVGYLDYDQEKVVSVTTRYPGFVEQTYVNYVGQPVHEGEPLFDIYSPELVQTEQELLSALDFARRLKGAPDDARRRAEALVTAARTRLSYWDISASQVQQLEKTGEVVRTLKVTAPASGVVMSRMPGLEGMAARPGMELFHIADLSSLWLTVEVFEDQLPWVHLGSPAAVSLTYFPGEKFLGRVRYIKPELAEKTRSVQLTIDVPNRNERLRAGMYATVVFEPVATRNAITVPSEAVLRTGERNVVVVALGGGRFAPRDVVLGPQGERFVEVLSGLRVGEEIVTSAQFLIDSESNLQEAIQKMIAARGASGDHSEKRSDEGPRHTGQRAPSTPGGPRTPAQGGGDAQ